MKPLFGISCGTHTYACVDMKCICILYTCKFIVPHQNGGGRYVYFLNTHKNIKIMITKKINIKTGNWQSKCLAQLEPEMTDSIWRHRHAAERAD